MTRRILTVQSKDLRTVRQEDLLLREIQLDAGTTKNDEARFAPMTDEVATLLTAYIAGKKPNDYVFTRPDATPVKGFRRKWATVCCAVGLGELVCPDRYRELKEQTIDAKGRCSNCGKKWRHQQLKYEGLKFHDLRRSDVWNLRRLGITETVAMKISGHKTRDVFERYNIVDKADIAEAGRKLNAKQNSNALLEIPRFGHDSGMAASKNAAKHAYSANPQPAPSLAPLPN